MKRLAIGILAHVDSGKTTLSEALLYRAGEIRKLGRVDHGDAFLDTHDLERKRGITIFSKQAVLRTHTAEYYLLDTPGHVDFSTEMERTLQALDYAVLVVSGTDGVQSHTETLWRLLAHSQIPTFLFINKMDLAGADRASLMADLRRLDGNCIDFDPAQQDGAFWESLAMCSEDLMEEILRGEVQYDFVEVMACPGGCVGGGGQPITDGMEMADMRGPKLYQLDEKRPLRFSHENPEVARLYEDYLGKPLGEKSHELLHTHG